MFLFFASCLFAVSELSFNVSLSDSANVHILTYFIFYLLSRSVYPSMNTPELFSVLMVILTPKYSPCLILNRMKYCNNLSMNTFIPSVYDFIWSEEFNLKKFFKKIWSKSEHF